MPTAGEDIRRALEAFVERWRGYEGGERQEAQTFLNELFACYGVDRKQAGVIFEDKAAPGFWTCSGLTSASSR